VIGHLVVSFGYMAVFVAVLLENVGLPLPGETTLVTAAAYAGATNRLSLAVIVVVAGVAAIAGGCAGYLLGRVGGSYVIARGERFFRMSPWKMEQAKASFQRHGAVAVTLGRFVTVVRTYVAFAAGVSGMAFARFFVFTVVGALAWAVLFGVGSYELGSTVNRIGTFATLGLVVAFSIALSSAIFMMRRRHLRVGFDPSDSGTPKQSYEEIA